MELLVRHPPFLPVRPDIFLGELRETSDQPFVTGALAAAVALKYAADIAAAVRATTQVSSQA